jgi:hypothetical protein
MSENLSHKYSVISKDVNTLGVFGAALPWDAFGVEVLFVPGNPVPGRKTENGTKYKSSSNTKTRSRLPPEFFVWFTAEEIR